MKNLKIKLSQFHGTEKYYQYNSLLLTDGINFLAKEAQCYWLLDVIESHIITKKLFCKDSFLVCDLKVKNHKAKFKIHNGFKSGDELAKTYARQSIQFTDFPLDVITIYAAKEGSKFILMLPSEY